MATPKRDVNIFNDDPPSFSKPRTQPLEVMIVGLSRTGTSSMLEAMNILGYGDIYNSRVMVRKHQGPFCGTILNKRLTGIGPPYGLEQFESLYGEHTCISGETVAPMAEDIIKAYPEAKVILTVRDDEDEWLASLCSTLWYNYSTWSHWFLRKVDRVWWEQNGLMDVYWNKFFAGDPAVHGLRVYREHNAMVKRVVEPKERLLVYSTSEGWGPLCRFLEKDVPDVEFPWVNRTQDHRALFGGGRRRSLRAWMMNAFVKGVLPTTAVALLVLRRRQVNEMVRQLLKCESPTMATSDEFNERMEALIRKTLLDEYPHMKTSTLNKICTKSAADVAYNYQRESKNECAGIHPLKFFDLPREIREIVYGYVVSPSDGLPITLNNCPAGVSCAWRTDTLDLYNIFNTLRPYHEQYVHGMQPAITRVSRQLRQEALPLFYQINVFAVCLARDARVRDEEWWWHSPSPLDKEAKHLAGVELLSNWLLAIGEKNVSNLVKITAHYTEEDQKKALLDMDLVPAKCANLVHIQDPDGDDYRRTRAIRDRLRQFIGGNDGKKSRK
ncbi:hypothetical protein M409DRAFT_16006 [Zasmidium cellare ATCC 36951]|uniref:Sulfotransferase domain-containing protein n=1 Tax=Zasmidium cellare ATCC 36951 TaxID=1080233 RepID=A0A6A6D685_ZASCE|nr:uncharacterized protein M409DRAFT_16006 [Zasmidium cellare ATCC 36951]KAF2173732.1 hypothetical protein M409DRAFT_16006 [Zasmidium cellare ATCC 36951]